MICQQASCSQKLGTLVPMQFIINKRVHDNIGYDILEKLQKVERKLDADVIDLMIKASFITDVYRSGRPNGYVKAKEYQHADEEDYKHIKRLTRRCLNFLEVLKKKSKKIEYNFEVASDK